MKKRWSSVAIAAVFAAATAVVAEEKRPVVSAVTPDGRTVLLEEVPDSAFTRGELKIVATTLIGPRGTPQARPASPQAVDPLAWYSNVTTSAAFYPPGGAALQGGNTITRLMADDLTTTATPLEPAAPLRRGVLALANTNGTAVTFRPRIRFWTASGTPGVPATFLAGTDFAPVTLAAANAVLANVTFGPFSVAPGSTIWAGITFDDDNGTTGATVALLNNIGMIVYAGAGAPQVGSSTDTIFQTTAAGDFATDSPAGSTMILGFVKADLGWELSTPVELQGFSAD